MSSRSESPPPAVAQSHGQRALSEHPLWRVSRGQDRPYASSAGRGRGRGRGRSAEPDTGGARYERLSLLAVELQGGAANDEADSALLSESDEEAGGGGGGGEERDGCDDYAASDNEDSDSEGEAHRKRQKKKQERRAQQQDLNFAAQAAAFGTTNALFGDADSDSESARSRTSSKRKRDNMKEAFPLKGIHCVGCSLATRIGPVEKFVNDYMGKMSENALWKSAALVWKRDVVEPAAREGVEVVEWSWKALATHFKLHTTNSVVGRTSMINSLTAMRMQVEQRLLRIEGEDCELDAKNADLCLKSKETQMPSVQDAVDAVKNNAVSEGRVWIRAQEVQKKLEQIKAEALRQSQNIDHDLVQRFFDWLFMSFLIVTVVGAVVAVVRLLSCARRYRERKLYRTEKLPLVTARFGRR